MVPFPATVIMVPAARHDQIVVTSLALLLAEVDVAAAGNRGRVGNRVGCNGSHVYLNVIAG